MGHRPLLSMVQAARGRKAAGSLHPLRKRRSLLFLSGEDGRKEQGRREEGREGSDANACGSVSGPTGSYHLRTARHGGSSCGHLGSYDAAADKPV